MPKADYKDRQFDSIRGKIDIAQLADAVERTLQTSDRHIARNLVVIADPARGFAAVKRAARYCRIICSEW